jgi:hypothetical protein
MTRQLYGVIGLCMLTAAILTGAYAISRYSVTAAGIYLAGVLVFLIAFIYAYCTKCPIRDRCVHVAMGLVTRLMPDRPAGPYTREELIAVVVFFGFVVIFPQYWLIRVPEVMGVFWVLFLGEWILTHYTCCYGCGNMYCNLRCER